ncbi:FkbM family methyltransferase [Rhodopila sp.]|uniref:FkbM family methyltransferase n=1 Tax=Rhodopila sp. TaxID=2480087 RepID=UPI003D107837
MNRAIRTVRNNEILYSAYRSARDAYSYRAGQRRGSFSQHGEDHFILEHFMRKRSGFYVDVGASHPYRLSNTYLLYENGWRGVTVEPIPLLGRLHRKWRPEDILVPKAVGLAAGCLEFKEMLPSVLSTLDTETAQAYIADGKAQLLRTYNIDVITLSQLFREYAGQQRVDFLSIDMEGLDAAIITSCDFNEVRPSVICIEANEQIDRARMLDYFETQKYNLLTELGCNLIVEDAGCARPGI